jgi:hypothetical protein
LSSVCPLVEIEASVLISLRVLVVPFFSLTTSTLSRSIQLFQLLEAQPMRRKETGKVTMQQGARRHGNKNDGRCEGMKGRRGGI